MKELSILCFGASLVEGFTQSGLKYTPYSVSMSKKLMQKFPQLRVKITVEGRSGDMVTVGYKGRMERMFSGE
jgi:hypothetical protein